jgi:hypothetical protein
MTATLERHAASIQSTLSCFDRLLIQGTVVDIGIQFTQVDNAFVSISDVEAAQFIANGLAPKKLHRRLDDAVRRFAPALRDFKSGIHWSLMQVEYSTDLVFSDAEVLKPMYEEIVRTLVHAVEKISARVREGDRTYRGFNMFDADDLAVVRAVAQAHLLGFGFRNRHVRQHLPHKNSSQIARAIKRLRTHGIVKKVAGAFRYYLTTFGKAVVASALKLKEMFLVPSLRGHLATP